MGKHDGQKVTMTADVRDVSVVLVPPVPTVDAEAAAKADAEAAAKADAEAKAKAEAAAKADTGLKLYTVTKGLPYRDTDQGVTFRPGERTPAKMTSWLDAQIKAGYIVEFKPE